MPGFVYVLTNPTIPDLVKIGKTSNLEERVKQLSSHSGVPIPFEVYYSCEVCDPDKVEKHLHEGFGDHRVNPKREFFRINPERVISILKLVEVRDVTPHTDIVEDEEERTSLNRERRRRSPFTFPSVEIPTGSVLHFVRDEGITATVVDDKNVEHQGEVTSLSKLSLDILTRQYGWNSTTITGPRYWVYENETLSERRLRMESDEG